MAKKDHITVDEVHRVLETSGDIDTAVFAVCVMLDNAFRHGYNVAYYGPNAFDPEKHDYVVRESK